MVTRNSHKTILSCSKGIVHPTFWARKGLKDILVQTNNCDIIQTHSIKFHQLIPKHTPDLTVLYFHQKKIRTDDLQALVNYVLKGGAILAIHSATASFKQEPAYHKLLGGRFIEHGPICEYTIQPSAQTREHFSTLDITFTIKDELYIHEYDSSVQVLLETQINDKMEPVAWVKDHGLGKVAYFAPGHRGSIFELEHIQKFLSELIDWSLSK